MLFPANRRRANHCRPKYYLSLATGLITSSCLAWKQTGVPSCCLMFPDKCKYRPSPWVMGRALSRRATSEVAAGQLFWWQKQTSYKLETTFIMTEKVLMNPSQVFTKPFQSNFPVGSRKTCPDTDITLMCTFSIVQNCRGSRPFPTFSRKTQHKYTGGAETQRRLYFHASAAKNICFRTGGRSAASPGRKAESRESLRCTVSVTSSFFILIMLAWKPELFVFVIFDVAWKRTVCNLGITPSVENEFPAERQAERSSDNWPNYCK